MQVRVEKGKQQSEYSVMERRMFQVGEISRIAEGIFFSSVLSHGHAM